MTSRELAQYEAHIHQDKYRRRGKRITRWRERYPAEAAAQSLADLRAGMPPIVKAVLDGRTDEYLTDLIK